MMLTILKWMGFTVLGLVGLILILFLLFILALSINTVCNQLREEAQKNERNTK